jgi:DNA-binding transcriptional MerR regulator
MKIGDFAAKSGLSADTLRYYERIGLLPRTVRDAGGRRSYGMDDLAWAAFLRKLQAMDMPMRDRLEYSRLRAEGDATLRTRRKMLEAHRDGLVARQAELAELVATLNAKIDQYIDMESQVQGAFDDGGQTHDDRGSGITPPRQRSRRGASTRA